MSSWPLVKLSEVATLSSGGTPSKANVSFWNGDIPWVSPKDMKTFCVADAEDKITREAITGSAAKIVGVNSVLAVVRSGILAHTFPVATLARDVSFNQDIKAITPKNSSLLPAYLFWMLKGQEDRILRIGVKKGATVHSLSNGFLEALAFPLPPLDEQRRIVRLLDRAAEIRRRANAARAKARAAKLALFIDIFGDPMMLTERFGGASFDNLVESKLLGLVRSTREQPDNGDFGYVRMNAITSDGRVMLDDLRRTNVTTAEAASYELEFGDLLFNTRNSYELVGKMGLYAGPSGNVFNNNIMRVRFNDRVLAGFVNAYFQTTVGQASITSIKKGTTSVCAIYYKDLAKVEIPLPPLSLQTAFVGKDQRLESAGLALDGVATKAKAMAAGLSAEIFRAASATALCDAA